MMKERRLGLLHPGMMGVTIGTAAKAGGADVLWASGGRSLDTRQRAAQAGIIDVETLAALVEQSGLVLSVCPPHAAMAVAASVAELGFDGVYVDANAVSPTTAQQIEQMVIAAGARFVDGGIIGPPAAAADTTRLYLSGAEAARVAALFEGTVLSAHVIDGRVGAASALKMCYAAYTKGVGALLLAVRTLARAEGVDNALLQEWALSQPGLAERSEKAASDNAIKAWRFSGEMGEIGATFQAVGLPAGFHRAAAAIYTALADFKTDSGPPTLTQVIDVLLDCDFPENSG